MKKGIILKPGRLSVNRRIVAMILLFVVCIICFTGCSFGLGKPDYTKVVKKAFVSDCNLFGYSTRLDLEEKTGDKVSFTPPKESEVFVTTVTEGEEYTAEGDIFYNSSFSGSATQHYVGTYTINDDGEAENISWHAE